MLTDTVAINGRDSASLLRYEASRKPELAALLAGGALALTDREIDALPYLPWIRNALKAQVAQAMTQVHYENAEARLADHIVTGFAADPTGVMFQYDGDTRFIPSGSGHLQVETGKLFFIDADYRIWLDTAIIRPDHEFMARSIRRGETTKLGYVAATKERLLKFNPNPPETVCAGAGPTVDRSQPLSHLGVTIQRS